MNISVSDAPEGFSDKWWQETKAMVEKGYADFCVRHKIDPGAGPGNIDVRRKRGRPTRAEQDARAAVQAEEQEEYFNEQSEA